MLFFLYFILFYLFIYLFFFLFFFFFCFVGPPLRHMEVPRLGVQSEPPLLAYTTATATPDPSHVCHLHHSSRQCRILNPLSEARDRTQNLMGPSRIHFHCTTTGTPQCSFFCSKIQSTVWFLDSIVISPWCPLICDSCSALPCFSWPWPSGGVRTRNFEECPSI